MSDSVEALLARLTEAEDLLREIRSGGIDAVVVSGPRGEQVYALSGAEHPYRVMVEAMREGAVVLAERCAIVYANHSFGAMLQMALDEVIGCAMDRFVAAEDVRRFHALIDHGRNDRARGEIRLVAKTGARVPVYLSVSAFDSNTPSGACAVVTDLTEHQRHQELISAAALERTRREMAEAHQRRVSSILETITDSFFAVDRTWRLTDVNQRGALNFSMARDELVGSSLWDLSFDGMQSELEAAYRKAMHDRIAVHVECASAIAPGRWFEKHIYPTEDGLAVYFRDITERKRIEKYTAYQATLLEHVHDAIVATDDRFVVTSWNAAAETVYGWKAADAIGRRATDVIRFADSEAEVADVLRVLSETGHYGFASGDLTRDRRPIWVEGHAAALRDRAGGITGYVAAIRDVTARRHADAALLNANDRIETILDSVTGNFFALGPDWRFTYLNKHAAAQMRALGKDPHALIGKTLWDEFPEVPNEAAVRSVMLDRIPIVDELYYPPLGEWVENHMFPSRDGGLVSFQVYVTERHRAEEELRRSEALLAEGQRITHTGSWVWNVTTGDLAWSAEHFRICGVDPATFTLTLETARQLIHPDDRAAVMEAYDRAVQERSNFDRELRIVRPDGTIRHVRSLAHPVFSKAGELTELVGTMLDITERKKEEETRETLRRRLIDSLEDERRRIALDLHDQFGQQLSALTMKLSALKRDCDRRTTLRAELAGLETITRQLDVDLELIVSRLRPPELDDLGLTAALAHYVKRWSDTTGVPAEWHATGVPPGRLTGEMEIALYRIAQEALNNVAKHAHASHVAVLLDVRSDRASLIIEDDGAGFDLEHPTGPRQRFGLNGMRERATLAGGTLGLESVPGKGTTVAARIPFPASPQGGEI